MSNYNPYKTTNTPTPTETLGLTSSITCSICMQQFNEDDRYPMIICQNQHYICLDCTQKYIFVDGNEEGKCCACRQKVMKKNMIKFRLVIEIKNAIKNTTKQNDKHKKTTQTNNNQQKLPTNPYVQQKPNKPFSKQWVNPQCNHYNALIFKQNTIAQRNQQSSHIFGNSRLNSQKYKFTIKVNKLEEWIRIGVIDQSYKKQMLNIKQCPNWICYCSAGNVLNKQQSVVVEDTVGFQQGESVTVEVSFKRGIISWKVNGEFRYIAQNDLLVGEDRGIKWVPYVHLRKGSVISIID